MTDSPAKLLIVGRSGCGKTTLVTRLIASLSEKGYRTGAVKRSHHNVDIDAKGKDSHKFSDAGANPVALISDRSIVYMEKLDEPTSLDEVIGLFHGKADIILIEGFKTEAAPRLVFVDDSGPTVADDNFTEGYLSAKKDNDSYLGKPLFGRDEIEKITAWVTDRFLEAKSEQKKQG